MCKPGIIEFRRYLYAITYLHAGRRLLTLSLACVQ